MEDRHRAGVPRFMYVYRAAEHESCSLQVIVGFRSNRSLEYADCWDIVDSL